METLHVNRDKDDFIEESKKIDEIHEGIKQFQKECRKAKSNKEKDELVQRFNEFVGSFGAAFELKVFATVDGPIIASEAKAGATFFKFFEDIDSDEITECLSECTKAFGREFQKYLKEYKEKDSAENRHCIHQIHT